MIQQRDTVRAASEFASRNQLPPNIQDQMLSHICLKFKTEGLKQQETLNSLPKAIRSSIANYLFLHILQKVYLFEGVSRNFLFQLVKHSSENSFLVHFLARIFCPIKLPTLFTFSDKGFRYWCWVLPTQRRCDSTERISYWALHSSLRGSGE